MLDHPLVQEFLEKIQLLSHDVITCSIDSLKSSGSCQWFEDNVWHIQEPFGQVESALLTVVDGIVEYLRDSTLFEL